MPVLAGAGWYNGLGFLLGTAHDSFEIFLKAMPPSLSHLKVLPSFCFAFKNPDDRAVTTKDMLENLKILKCRVNSLILGCPESSGAL